MRHLTCDPNAEVIGSSAISYIENINSKGLMPILQKHGLSEMDSDKWYPCVDILNVLNDVAQQPDFTSNFVAIGLKIAEVAMLPPTVNALSEILLAFDGVYQMNHRNGEIGRFVPEKISGTHYTIRCEDVYPDDLSYGILYGLARRFLPKGTSFRVAYDDPNATRDNGGEETLIHVEWE